MCYVVNVEPGIYIVRVGLYVKIGTTGNLRRRIRELELRRGCRFPDDIEDVPVELVGTLWGGEDCERALHQAFADLHVVGEWFRYEGRMVDWCARRSGCLPLLPGEQVVF